MYSPKKPLVPIALTQQNKANKLLNHLVRLGLRMHEHGWLGSECLTYKMESDKRIRIEYSINPLMYTKRIVVVAEQEKVRIVNNNPTHFKPIGAIVDALQWNIKEIQTNADVWNDIPQSLKQQMRWVDFEYKKGVSATRDAWLTKLRAGSRMLATDETSTNEWLSHVQSILEFEHPLNKTVHSVVSNFLPTADPVLLHNIKLRHYTENASKTPTLSETIETVMPIMLDEKRTWPGIRLHKDRDGNQHFVFSTSESVVPILHVKRSSVSGAYTLLDSNCKNLDDAKDIHNQLLHAMSKPSIPLETAWLEQLRHLSDFKLLELDGATTRPDQLWIRSVKNYAEQIHVEMVRSDTLYEPWAQHLINHGDSNVVATVLAAMKLARGHQLEKSAEMDTTPGLSS